MPSSLEKAQHEVGRWRILKILDSGRPGRLSEDLIRVALNDAEIQFTAQELRRELDYLALRKMVELHGQKTPHWSARLTRLGIEIVEYMVDCEPGIARPDPL